MYNYNNMGQLTEINPYDNELDDYTAAYKLDGNKESERYGEKYSNYKYNGLGQLSEEYDGYEEESTIYKYDTRGNRVSAVRLGVNAAHIHMMSTTACLKKKS